MQPQPAHLPRDARARPTPTASRPVRSRQDRPHRRIEEVVSRHLEHPWRAPLHRPTAEAFGRLLELLEDGEQGRLVLDSGCGTGISTSRLGRRYPDCVIVGIDRSGVRLGRHAGSLLPRRRGNCVWVRAELASFWRLALAQGWRLRHHFLLYPNPWPKPAHLKRRWHAHPAFPALLQLGGELEMRCNWRVFADEFARAAQLATGLSVGPERLAAGAALSPFEEKYRASGQALYRVRFSLVEKSPGCPGLKTLLRCIRPSSGRTGTA